ncbi:MAG: hypothetical protein J6S14_12920 [Clostridia bacterium]|nr:hypothetical protein [Clostridia bacterium]
MIARFCRKIAGVSFWLCLLVVLGIVGKIENGGSMTLGWWAVGALGWLLLILLGASHDKS